MKILVTGANGQLGTELLQSLAQTSIEIITATRSQLDITIKNHVKDYLRYHRPDWVVNCAAYTDVDLAEKNLEQSYLVNAMGPENLAQVCESVGSKLLQISTNSVFSSDTPKFFTPDDIVNPMNQYSKSKALGEKLIVKNCSKNYWIIRTSWLYGNYGGKFVHSILEKNYLNNPISVVDDQFGQPTNSQDLAEFVKSFILEPPSMGIYHFTNIGYVSRFDLAKQILFFFSGDDSKVKRIKTKKMIGVAERSRYSLLSLENDSFAPKNEYIPYDESLRQFLVQRQKIR
jgi:dTDP-4-dehydrorhamnose reductase